MGSYPSLCPSHFQDTRVSPTPPPTPTPRCAPPPESKEMKAAKSEAQSMPDGMLTELRSLYHTEETPLFIVKTFGAVRFPSGASPSPWLSLSRLPAPPPLSLHSVMGRLEMCIRACVCAPDP